MGGAVLAKIHIIYGIPGGIQLEKLLIRFSYENLNFFSKSFVGIE